MSPIVVSVVLFLVTVGESLSRAHEQNNKFLRMKRDSDPDATNYLQELLRQARMEQGALDFDSLLARNIKDPVPLEDFNVSSNGLFTDIFGRFTNLQLHGLRRFHVDRITMNLSKMNLSAVMRVPILSVVGDYFLDGTITFIPVSGEGWFWMNMTTIELRGYSTIRATPEGRLTMEEIKLESDVGDIALHFDNLMGGGTWGSISNSILNQLSELIFGELKHTLLNEMSSFLEHQFNGILFRKLPNGFMDPGATNFVDSILEKATVFMSESGYEPLRLPNHKEVYERNLFFVTTRGVLELYNGTLYGLSTLYRKGDVVTVFANNSILLEADFGFENLTGGYLWSAELFGTGPSGSVDIQVKSVEGFVRLRKDLKSESKLQLDTLHIDNVQHVWLDIHGMGTWDYIMEIVVNLITNGLKMQLADVIAEPVKSGIQNELNSLEISMP